ncbi:MAG: 2-succinyl-6-hydroxy-2,4-cyclohexadiene-1-carboxylate synthase [Chroococcidiopsis sp. SAG 2025]|uniref:alpha/beta fold hydrolase n=1 Tax=Chroococcidiopsis sp. SAG 2025 TaxID=171389 RepID=UPI0029372885|nr:alpha/beta hydrolase [Chroococcidiopsis sp. SAG 2025]MDV2995785.1 2-succinyl-6-hydroxy-2,4-cyclohexadiene-1-carboxylate synthase [Chroococcidiopsis sp. SAG 2025]
MATIEIAGVRHVYELTAPTTFPHALVFVHGWLLSRAYWQPLIERLAVDYQCLSYDLRGFGQSHAISSQEKAEADTRDLALNGSNATKEDSSPYSPTAYARDLKCLLQELNISSAWLIGHSLGGTIALWTAQQMPQSVQGVICVNAGGGIYLKESFEQFRAVGTQLVKLRPRWLPLLPLVDLWMTRANVARAIARSWGRQRIVDLAIAHPEAALGALLDSTTETEINRLPQIVSQLQQPVYFLAGDKDKIMEPKYVRHLASFHPLFQACGENAIEIPECGHLAMLEQTDMVAEQIRAIVTQYK